MIKKSLRIIEREDFDTRFIYEENNKVGIIIVQRISGEDNLQIIKFWGNDRLKTFEQFKDACTCWIDQNIA